MSKAHVVIAQYYFRGLTYLSKSKLSDQEFSDYEEGCKHLHLAGNSNDAEQKVLNISKIAKGQGKYRLLINLCRLQLTDNPARSNWIDYNLAHALLILGDSKGALVALEPLLNANLDENLSVQIARLYTEVQLFEGQPQKGYDTLNQRLQSVDKDGLAKAVYSQCLASLSECLRELNRLDESEEKAQEMVAKSYNNLSQAVGFGNWGIIAKLKKNDLDAIKYFQFSFDLFSEYTDKNGEIKDKRGFAWAMFNLASTMLARSPSKQAENFLLEALEIKKEIREATPTYLQELVGLKLSSVSQNAREHINSEVKRVSSAII